MDKLIAFDLKTNTKSVLLDRQMHPFGLAVWQDYLYWSGQCHEILLISQSVTTGTNIPSFMTSRVLNLIT